MSQFEQLQNKIDKSWKQRLKFDSLKAVVSTPGPGTGAGHMSPYHLVKMGIRCLDDIRM